MYLRKKPDRSLNISFFTKVDGPEHVDAGLDRAVAGAKGQGWTPSGGTERQLSRGPRLRAVLPLLAPSLYPREPAALCEGCALTSTRPWESCAGRPPRGHPRAAGLAAPLHSGLRMCPFLSYFSAPFGGTAGEEVKSRNSGKRF